MRTVIFDLDGTLADTSGDLIEAANARFRALGHGDVLDPLADALVAFHGGRAMLRLGFERLGVEDIAGGVEGQYRPFLAAYEEGIDRQTRLYPGAVEAICALRGAGYRVGVCTNKPEGLARLLLERLGVLGLFGSLVGADTFPVRKPDPLPYREAVVRAGGAVGASVLIGDTVTDRDTGRAAGVPVVLVTFGPAGDAVRALEPEALLGRYEDLPVVVERLIG